MIKKILPYIFFAAGCLSAHAQDDSKSQQQQQMLLSRGQQVELARQQQQKLLFEKQQQQLADQEKRLLQFQFEKKQGELENAKKEAAARIQKNQMKAQYEATLKDKQITTQNATLGYTRKWIFYLVTLFLVTIVVAVIAYLNQQKTKKLNRLISTQHKELEQVSMVKDRLLTVVGHDMRSPVNMLISFTELLQDGDIPPDKMKQYMEKLGSTLVHTSSLMDNLLQWAASQMQGYKPYISSASLYRIAVDSMALLQARAADKKINLVNGVPENMLVLCDMDMMALVLRNIVSNAIKFTPSGGSVVVGAVEKDRYVSISIADNGVGMSEENRRRFNTPTIEASQSTAGTDREKGTGLGLLLCKTFTRQMNGQISVTADGRGSGCIFEIVLPNGKPVPA